MNDYIGPYSPKYYKKRLYNQQYRAANKEKLAEDRKKYYQKNKEQELVKQKQYRESNKLQIKDYQSQYYQFHKDEINAQKRINTTYRRQLKYKYEKLQDLKDNPHQHTGKRILHRIKTDEIDFSINGPLSQEEIDLLNTIQLPPIPLPQRRKYQGSSRQKYYRNKKILRRQTDMLNKDFSRKDPNRFLPLSEILNYGNYSYDFLPQREIFKIKNYKRESLHEQWQKEYNNYMDEVKKISNEDKIKFLENK